MSQALYRKWRPHRWEDVVGQEHVVQTLRNSITAGRVAHALLFAGPRGTGKTTTARLLAKAVNCLGTDQAARPCDACDFCQAVNQGRFMDLIEIDAASNTSVEDVRDLRDKINFSPSQGKYKVYIIDEVHMLSTAAFNALLKTLEEPPAHAMFILATTEVHKIPATVLSRCQRHEFRRIPIAEIVTYLRRIADSEKIQIDTEALTLVARQASGGMRDAISLLDQLSSMGEQITLQMAQAVLGTATSQSVLSLVTALVQEDAAAGLDQIHTALDAGSDPRQFARQIVEYLRGLLLIRMGSADQVEATSEVRAQMAQHAHALTAPVLLHTIQAFNAAATETRAWMPALPLEVALVQSLDQPAAVSAPSQAASPHLTEAQPRAATSAPRATRPAPPTPEPEPPAIVPEDSAQASPGQSIPDAQWRQVLTLVRQQNVTLYGLLNSNKARRLDGSILTLGFASDVQTTKMQAAASAEIVQNALQQALGREIEIRCVTLTGKRTTPPPGVDGDGMVASALRDLGGEIVDVQ